MVCLFAFNPYVLTFSRLKLDIGNRICVRSLTFTPAQTSTG